MLEAWMRSYRPGRALRRERRARRGPRRAAAQGASADERQPARQRRRAAHRPAACRTSVTMRSRWRSPARPSARRRGCWAGFLRDVIDENPDDFRLFGPDETASNRLSAVFEKTDRAWDAERIPIDDHLAPDGRVMEVLSEHLCQGWLEGYLLTGRHGLFNCYEAFIHIIDSMFNQHAKWLKVTREIPWRRPIASLNYLLSSHVWRQDHNGFSHQDPGFIDHVVNKKAEVIRVYLPPDANTLLSVADHCLRSRNYVNVIVAGKQPELNWLSMDEAVVHATRGAGIWDFASNDHVGEPDVVLACCGDVPTLETVAAADLLRQRLPDLKVRVVNVVDLMRLQPESEHPARHVGRGVRRAVHDRPARHLRLPRLPVADPSAHLPADEPRQLPRARLQGGGHHHHAVRHGDAQRPRPLPPGDGRDRPHSRPRLTGRARAPGDESTGGSSARAVHPRARRGHAGDPAPGPGRTDRGGGWTHADPGRQRGLQQPEAAPARRR